MRTKRPTGKVNPISVALIAAIVGGIYWLVIFSPVYLDNIDVAEAVVSAYNGTNIFTDERVLLELKDRLKRIGTHRELNEEGELVEVPGLGVADEDIFFEKNPDGTVTVQVSYVREVRLTPSKKWSRVRFSPKKVGRPVRK